MHLGWSESTVPTATKSDAVAGPRVPPKGGSSSASELIIPFVCCLHHGLRSRHCPAGLKTGPVLTARLVLTLATVLTGAGVAGATLYAPAGVCLHPCTPPPPSKSRPSHHSKHAGCRETLQAAEKSRTDVLRKRKPIGHNGQHHLDASGSVEQRRPLWAKPDIARARDRSTDEYGKARN